MTATETLNLPYIMPSQAQKHLTHNEALRMLDALTQIAVVSRSASSPPAEPLPGARWIVPAAAIGAFAGRDGAVAAFQDGVWAFYVPQDGWTAYVLDEDRLCVRAGGVWSAAAQPPRSTGYFSRLGVAAEADPANSLVVAGDACLFTPGEGDSHRLAINKDAPAATASLLFQTGYSGRAEFGLAGDDDWRVKVSPDGATWHEALVVSHQTGALATPQSLTAANLVATTPVTLAWTLDSAASAVTLASGETIAFPVGSGLAVVTDMNATGCTALFLLGGNSVALVGQSSAPIFVAGMPTEGKAGIFFDEGQQRYAFQSRFVLFATFAFTLIRTRTFT